MYLKDLEDGVNSGNKEKIEDAKTLLAFNANLVAKQMAEIYARRERADLRYVAHEYVFYSKQKLRNVYRTIDALLDGDFPINSGKDALNKLRQVFEEQEKKIDRAHRLSDDKTEKQISNIINVKIYQALPIF